MFIFTVQLTTSRIGNLTRLMYTLLYVMTIHTWTKILCLSFSTPAIIISNTCHTHSSIGSENSIQYMIMCHTEHYWRQSVNVTPNLERDVQRSPTKMKKAPKNYFIGYTLKVVTRAFCQLNLLISVSFLPTCSYVWRRVGRKMSHKLIFDIWCSTPK